MYKVESTSREMVGVGPALLAIIECVGAFIAIAGASRNPGSFGGAFDGGHLEGVAGLMLVCAALSVCGLGWAIHAMRANHRPPNASCVPAYLAIGLHALLCLPGVLVLLVMAIVWAVPA
ncbi:hypothetical protein [Paraburkholderia adhaesiva]|uniref:hypothetical protein n=1 Tax=Paraburkholderia adhaesiva TaxID=2883244 RepID=UPI001F2DA945|nr:hypothetical protein [Paraburkholderia adhaesiva]